MGAALSLAGLTKAFGPDRGVFGLDLVVPVGAVFGFLGPNGAGKTTTIRLLLDFLRPQAGTARVLGLDAHRETVAIRRRLGYLPAEFHLFERLTGMEFLTYLSRLRGREVPRGRLLELRERLGADLEARIRMLSRGNKQKLGILGAFLHDPELLILDEPTEGLDPLVQQAFFDLLDGHRGRGGTVFMSSHVLSEVERVCDQVAIIRAGRLAAVERVEDLVRKKVRHLDVTFGQDVSREALLEGLPGASILAWDGRRARLALSGPVDPVLKRLAGFVVADVVFAPASLEEAFLDFYRRDG